MTSSATDRPVIAQQTPPVVLRAKEQAENFPVAMLALPRALRRDLRVVYDVVRVIDDLGDEAPGDRTALLTDFADDLHRVWTDGRPHASVLAALVPVVVDRGLSRDPFERLVRANLADQKVTAYDTFDDLLAYCDLSAAPIGRIVLEIFGVSTLDRIALSDQVCNALQVLEHCQDVAEDHRNGRVYLPQTDLDAYGVRPLDFGAASAAPTVRSLLHFETSRASAMLDAGVPLVAGLRGWARLAVAGYLAGGRAAVDALRRCDGDVLAGAPAVRRRDVARHLIGVLRGARR